MKRRESVNEVLGHFKKGHRDASFAYVVIKDLEQDDITSIEQALEQLIDVLCELTLFEKAYQIMKVAMKDKKDSARLHEIFARYHFIMEDFLKSIHHNKQAISLQPDNCAHNHSDCGLAFYRHALIESGDPEKSNAFLSKAMKCLDEALVKNP